MNKAVTLFAAFLMLLVAVSVMAAPIQAPEVLLGAAGSDKELASIMAANPLTPEMLQGS